jgi:hypothetical protein
MLVESFVLLVALSRTPEVCETGKRILCIESCAFDQDVMTVTAIGEHEPQFYCSADLETALSADLALVAEVKHVLVEKADNNLLVWIAVDNPIRSVRDRVFRKELELIEGFPEIDFDFNIIATKNGDPRQFASSAKVIYSREDDNGAN